MKKQLLFILLFLPAFLTAKEIRYFVQPGEILDLSENAFERHGIKVSEIDSVSMSGSFTFSIKVRSHARELGEKALITNKKNNIPNRHLDRHPRQRIMDSALLRWEKHSMGI